MEPIKFKDMTTEQRSEIVEAMVADRMSVEFYSGGGRWKSKLSGSLNISGYYRIKPRQLDIPWDMLRPEIVYVAMDMDCRVFGHVERPTILSCCKWVSAAVKVRLDAAITIDTTGIDWRESLVMRPGYEEGEE